MVRPEGIEPPAYRFEACRSIHLSYGRVNFRRLDSAGKSRWYHRITVRTVATPTLSLIRCILQTRAGSQLLFVTQTANPL
jgi:hypothetical protein